MVSIQNDPVFNFRKPRRFHLFNKAEKLLLSARVTHIYSMSLAAAGTVAAALVGDAIWDWCKEVSKQVGANPLEKIGDDLLSRIRQGTLPPNHNLDHALRRSLAEAASFLAWNIHDPNLLPISKLIMALKARSLKDRAVEMFQKNISPKNAADRWLAALIEQTKKTDSFNDFSLDLVLAGDRMTSLLLDQMDHRLRDHIQHEFIAWSNRHLADNPNKPGNFDEYVLTGWIPPDSNGSKITFYQVFCLFFREELKKNPVVFHAFTANTLADLKADIAEVLGNFDNFKGFLDSQNSKLFESLTRIEAGMSRLETGQTDLKAGMELLLENQQTILDEIKRPQIMRSASDTDEKLPDDIKAIIKEAGKILTEGRYIEARQKLESAMQLAEKQKCPAALIEIRIDVAESYILEDSDVVAARDDLLSCLRELSKDTQAKQRREVLALLGHAESLLDNFEDSKSLYREARQLAQKQKNRFAEAHALMGLSHAEEFLGNLKEANSLLDEATELNRAEYREATSDEKPRAALNLGACLSTKAALVRREARLAESIVYLSKAEPLFREAKSFDNLGRNIMLKAEVLFTEAKWQEGFDALKESLSIFESIGNITWQCRCLDRMARLYFIHENGKQALACLGKALHLLGSVQRDDDAVPYLLKFAGLCQKYDQDEKAKEFIGKARQIATKLKDDSLIAECLVAEARLLKGKEDEDARKKLLSSAMKHLESALSECEVKGRRAEYMQQLGDLHGWLHNLHDARNWFERALHEHEEIGDIAGICECLAYLAAADREENHSDKAIARLERLLEISEGKPLYHIRAAALNDLGSLKMFQGDENSAKQYFEKAKALAEKHNFRDVLDALKASSRRLDESERMQQPAHRDIPSLIRELHEWCARYPKLRQAILPLWYHLHHVEIWSICRSMLGVKFLICTKDSLGFRTVADALRGQGDLFCWGINFTPKTKYALDIIPYPMEFVIPAGAKIVTPPKVPSSLEAVSKGLLKAVGENGYIFTILADAEKRFPGVGFCVLGKHIRLAPMIYKIMLEISSETLIANNQICLPIRESDELNVADAVRAASGNGMIPVFQERLPHDDEIKVVYDNLFDIPRGNESAASAAKGNWTKFLSACQTSPQASLSEFSKEMSALTATCGNENKLRVRIYLLRFQAGGKEIIHPAVVLI
jgi:tetratricopeptide (TPR) repeat protein